MLKTIAYNMGRLYGKLPTLGRVIVVGMLLLAGIWILMPSGKLPETEAHGREQPQGSSKNTLTAVLTPEQEAERLKLHEKEAMVERDHIDAKYVCQQFTLKQLKTPSAAKFESLETVAAVPSKDKKWGKLRDVWDSMGWVDSQNSFGALLRSEYICTVQKAPDGRWKLLAFDWLK